MTFDSPGTIDDLVRDAAEAGYQVTRRLVRDWSERGLLGRPRRRPRGRGKGSSQALYDKYQRELFVTLLSKRVETQRIPLLAQIPIWIWVHFGEPYVGTPQALLAFRTWSDDPRASQERAKTLARQLTHDFSADDAPLAARRRLEQVLADVAYTGRLNKEQLLDAVRAAFQPSALGIQRAVGPPTAALISASVVEVIRLRILAAQALEAGRVAGGQLEEARQRYLLTRQEYLAEAGRWDEFASGHRLSTVQIPTAQQSFDTCANDLLLALGALIAHQSQ